jgi:hypothetical protein
MADRKKQSRDEQPTERASDSLASLVTKGQGLWLETQAELLREMNELAQNWTERRREDLDAAQQSMERMREFADHMRMQQEWIVGSMRRWATDVEAWATMTGNLWQRSLVRAAEAGRHASEEVRTAGEAVASAAGDMLTAAGDKPTTYEPAR